MKTSKTLILSSSAVAALLWAGLAAAQEVRPSKGSKGDQLQVDPAVAAKYEAQAQRRVVEPDLPIVEWEQDRAVPSRRVSARILSIGDQSVLVAVPLSPEQKAVLSQRWPTVTRAEEANHQTIWGDELCLRYPVTLEYDALRLSSKLGQVVELEVGSTQDKRPIVIFVRGT